MGFVANAATKEMGGAMVVVEVETVLVVEVADVMEVDVAEVVEVVVLVVVVIAERPTLIVFARNALEPWLSTTLAYRVREPMSFASKGRVKATLSELEALAAE